MCLSGWVAIMIWMTMDDFFHVTGEGVALILLLFLLLLVLGWFVCLLFI